MEALESEREALKLGLEAYICPGQASSGRVGPCLSSDLEVSRQQTNKPVLDCRVLDARESWRVPREFYSPRFHRQHARLTTAGRVCGGASSQTLQYSIGWFRLRPSPGTLGAWFMHSRD
jgi:hypothetical protein